MFRFNRFPNTHNQEASAQAKGAGAKEEVSRKRKSAEVEPLRPRTQTEIESNQIGYWAERFAGRRLECPPNWPTQ